MWFIGDSIGFIYHLLELDGIQILFMAHLVKADTFQ